MKEGVVVGCLLLVGLSSLAAAEGVAAETGGEATAGDVPAPARRTLGTVVLVRDRQRDSLSRQLAVELNAMGFEVLPGDHCDRDAVRGQLGEASRDPACVGAHCVDAVLCVIGTDEGRDAVVLVVPGGQALTSARPDDLAPRLFAVRMAEQTRASLFLSEVTSTDAESTVPPEASETSPLLPRFELGAGAAVEGAPGGLGVAGRLAVRVGWWPWKSFGFVGMGLLPVHPQVVDEPEGRAEVWTTSLAVGPAARIRPLHWLQFDSSLLVGGGFVVMNGDADGGNTGTSDLVMPALLGVEMGTSWFPSPRLFLRLGGQFFAYAPTLAVEFADRQVAKREYWLTGGVTLGVALP